MQYREFRPGLPLRPFVRLLWSMRASDVTSPGGAERIVPDGCPEIVLNLADRFRRLKEDGTSHQQAEVLVVGQFRRAITIVPTGEVNLIGIRFEPGGMHRLLGVPMHELVDVDFCLGQAQRGLRSRLLNAARADRLAERIMAIQGVLRDSLELRGGAAHAGLAGEAVRLVESGLFTVDRVSDALRLNRRALERIFRTEVGLSPKALMRIHRLQSVLQQVEGGRPAGGWADLAVKQGYADQSHLIRDFQQIAGTTPERYLAERTALASCFEA